MTHGISDPPGRFSTMQRRQEAEVARLNQENAAKDARIAELTAALRALYDAVNLHEDQTPAMVAIERIMGWTKEEALKHIAMLEGADDDTKDGGPLLPIYDDPDTLAEFYGEGRRE